MRLSSLIRLWVWTTLLAIVAFAILAITDQTLKAQTGFGTVDLQSASSALGFKRVFAAWIARPHAAAAGFGLGFDYLFMPLYAMSFYFSAILEREAFAPKPFLVKCSGGQDRTSLAAALYLLHRGGWSAMAPARAQFARWPYLHFPKPEQRWLRHFIEFAQDDAEGIPIANWIRSVYTPERLRDWLAARGRSDTFKAIFEKPAPANRWQW